MPRLLEQIAPGAEVNIFGEEIDQTSWSDFAGRVACLPVCNFTDLKKAILYSHSPYVHEQEDRVAHPNRGEAYAWRRLPRFLDRFKEVRERMRATSPNELLVSLDVGSSIPIYSEMMRAHWLRKCGDHAQQGLKFAIESYEDRSRQSNAILNNHFDRDSAFKLSFVSCLQTCLYCIPYSLSGEDESIRDFLESTMRGLMANAVRHIDRRDKKEAKVLTDLYGSLGMNLDPSTIQRTPMERAWRIDAVLGPSLNLRPDELLLQTTYRDPLDPEVSKKAQRLHKRARVAELEGDHSAAQSLRSEALALIERRPKYKISQEEAACFIDDLIKLSVDWLVRNGYASPARFFSIDKIDPQELLEEAQSSLDAETKLTGFCRRTFERIRLGDPDHIFDEISSIKEYLDEETVSSITSIESYPFYAPQPANIREVGRLAVEIAENMATLASLLKRRGEYMTFPWGRMPETEGITRIAQIATNQLPEEILRVMASRNHEGEFIISTDLHSMKEVLGWLSQGEFDTLVGVSEALSLRPEDLVRVLRIRRVKKPAPSGKLLGARF
jgi:hypothetical protein